MSKLISEEILKLRPLLVSIPFNHFISKDLKREFLKEHIGVIKEIFNLLSCIEEKIPKVKVIECILTPRDRKVLPFRDYPVNDFPILCHKRLTDGIGINSRNVSIFVLGSVIPLKYEVIRVMVVVMAVTSERRIIDKDRLVIFALSKVAFVEADKAVVLTTILAIVLVFRVVSIQILKVTVEVVDLFSLLCLINVAFGAAIAGVVAQVVEL
jgi:hypothetical protein